MSLFGHSWWWSGTVCYRLCRSSSSDSLYLIFINIPFSYGIFHAACFNSFPANLGWLGGEEPSLLLSFSLDSIVYFKQSLKGQQVCCYLFFLCVSLYYISSSFTFTSIKLTTCLVMVTVCVCVCMCLCVCLCTSLCKFMDVYV